ncbi:MAG: hypothetical protein V3U11_06145, partial [Planctomycetota bacterium]
MPDHTPARIGPTNDEPIDLFTAVGTTGLRRFGGFVEEEWHRRLKGRLGVRNYREMSDNNAVVGAFLFAIEMFIRQVEWHVVPADEEDKAQEASQFVEECVDDMSTTWEDFIAEVITMLPYGWSWFEQI